MKKALDILLSSMSAFMQKSIALPDVHSGYGFAIGNVAAFDMSDPEAVVSPGGVGFDINCGVRLLRTNLVSSKLSIGSKWQSVRCTWTTWQGREGQNCLK